MYIGKGPELGTSDAVVVVALYAITASGMASSQVAELLGHSVILLLLDLCGQGEGSAHPGLYTIEGHAKDVTAAECTQPLWLLRAPGGILDDPNSPLIPEHEASQFVQANPKIHYVVVPDVKHYMILLGRLGAAAVADAIRVAVALW